MKIGLPIALGVIVVLAGGAWFVFNEVVFGDYVADYTIDERLMAQTEARLGVVENDLAGVPRLGAPQRRGCFVDSGELSQPSTTWQLGGTEDDVVTAIKRRGWNDVTRPGDEAVGRSLVKRFDGWTAQIAILYDRVRSATHVAASIEGAEPCRAR
jgi:hypothetical protein